MRGTLIIFVKAPVAGRVKTRLARDLGAGRAAAVCRHLTALTIANASAGDWRTILAIDPPAAVSQFSTLWPRKFKRFVQASGDLGDRLRAAFESAPKGPVVVIGADAPGLRKRHIRSAFRALAGRDAVFGPAADGGFWLIGLRRVPSPGVLVNVRWSTRHALADTLKTLPGTRRVAFLERLCDVDHAADLATLGRRALLRSPASL